MSRRRDPSPDFAATNAPGTCLWCGRKLRRPCRVEWERNTDAKPRRCYGRVGNYRENRCDSTKIKKDAEGYWRCHNNHYVKPPAKRKTRTPMYDKPGDYGDGHFCGLRCAYAFAVTLADGGRRLGTTG